MDIYRWLGRFNVNSLFPAHHDVDLDLHSTLLLDLGCTELTLEDAFGDSVGKSQPFIGALRALLLRRTDVRYSEIVQSFAMVPATHVDVFSIKKMLADFRQFHANFDGFFDKEKVTLLTTKKALVSNLQPVWFRSTYRARASDTYCAVDYTLSELIADIITEAEEQAAATLTISRRGLPSALHVTTSPDSPTVANVAAVSVAPVSLAGTSTKRNFTCWNCKTPSITGVLDHYALACTAPCRIHNSDCKKKNQCCREADSVRSRFPPAQVRLLARSSNAISPSTMSPLRDKAPLVTDILIDTGANVLCVHRKDYFSGDIVEAAERITIADGAPVEIPGVGLVGACHGRYIPKFDRTLVPAGVITENSIMIVDGNGMNIIPSTPSTVEGVRSLITESPTSLSMFIPVVNGLFPISKSQLARITMSGEERARLLSLVEHSAHSSYFTVKLDSIGETVRFWHETWKHASKKDMIRIIANQMFADIPKELTITAVNKHFDDHCLGCKKATLRETSKPQESTRVYKAGEGCAMDISYWTSSPDFGGNIYCCHSLDLGSGKSWEDPLSSLANLDKLIGVVHDRFLDQGYLLEFVRID